VSESTWGYAGQVGQWSGLVPLPDRLVGDSLASTEYTLATFIPALSPIHRPASSSMSWVEYSDTQHEPTYHELEEVPTADWEDLRQRLARLAAGTTTVAVHALFADLDTSVVGTDGDFWAEESATFQISVTSGDLGKMQVGVMYSTYIDTWLSTTYGENYQPRSNARLAALNRPRLEAFLHTFAEIVGDSFTTELSQLYYFAITPTGFRDADELPPRSP
jgi:hypothetical protein